MPGEEIKEEESKPEEPEPEAPESKIVDEGGNVVPFKKPSE